MQRISRAACGLAVGLSGILLIVAGCVPVTRQSATIEKLDEGRIRVVLTDRTTGYGFSAEGWNSTSAGECKLILSPQMRLRSDYDGEVYRLTDADVPWCPGDYRYLVIDKDKRYVYLNLYEIQPPMGMKVKEASYHGRYPVRELAPPKP